MRTENFLEFRPMFRRDDGSESFNLYELTSPDLMLDLSSESGFKEIAVLRPWQTGFEDDCKKDLTDLEAVCSELSNLLRESIEKGWNSGEKHLVLVSGGKDSKLLCYALKYCEKKFGKEWLGQTVFLHRNALNSGNVKDILSSGVFWALMEFFGWKDRAYEVKRKVEDHVDFSPILIPNAFWPYYFYWYSCFLADPAELKDWVLVTGRCGGEILAPKLQGRTPSDDRYSDLKRFVKTGNGYLSIFHNYKDLFQPFLYKPFIKSAFGMHDSLLARDAVRTGMLGLWRDEIPSFKGSEYSWVCSQGRLDLVHELWKASRFRRDFSDQLGEKKNIKITNEGMGLWGQTLDSKLFGLAMTYDYGMARR